MLQECILNRLKSLNWCEGKSEPKNTNKTVSDKETVVVVVLLFYVHGKHLRSCRDGQLT